MTSLEGTLLDDYKAGGQCRCRLDDGREFSVAIPCVGFDANAPGIIRAGTKVQVVYDASEGFVWVTGVSQ